MRTELGVAVDVLDAPLELGELGALRVDELLGLSPVVLARS